MTECSELAENSNTSDCTHNQRDQHYPLARHNMSQIVLWLSATFIGLTGEQGDWFNICWSFTQNWKPAFSTSTILIPPLPFSSLVAPILSTIHCSHLTIHLLHPLELELEMTPALPTYGFVFKERMWISWFRHLQVAYYFVACKILFQFNATLAMTHYLVWILNPMLW